MLRVWQFRLFAGVIATVLSVSVQAEECSNVQLTKEELKTLKNILDADKSLRDMIKAEKGLSALNTALKGTIEGPIKLAFIWNQGSLAGWRNANKQLAAIHKDLTCASIVEVQTFREYSQCFWDNLAIARGCKG
ncbi:MAG: hypothetical protein ACKVP2_14340 [Burkholderiales bacterium]